MLSRASLDHPGVGFAGIVGTGLVDEFVLCYLTLRELSWLEMSCAGMCQAVSTGSAWGAALGRELKGIALQDLFQKSSVVQNHRRDLKELTNALSHALPVLDKVPLPLSDVAELKELTNAVRRAFTVADAHVAASNQDVKVLFGRFRFAGASSPRAARPGPAAVANAPAEGLSTGRDGDDWCLSAPMPFTFVTDRPCSTTTGAAGQSTSIKDFAMRLAWKGNAVLLNVAPWKEAPGSIGSPGASGAMRSVVEWDGCKATPALAIDICAVGKAPLLRVRNTLVQIDGKKWQSVRGIAAGAEFSRAELAEALSPGLFCIVTVREASGQQAPQGTRDIHALHLEASSRRRALARP